MQELIKKIKESREARDWEQYHSPKNLVMALSVEVAELAEHFQWLTQRESHNLSNDKLKNVREEIGDIMIYLANLADKLGIDPLAAAHEKLKKNELKYPVNQVRGKSEKYNSYPSRKNNK
jgi:NTP pyrophosphatase (non-canonical NTP hydrolase)